MRPSERAFSRLAWGALVYTLVVVIWGAYVRASGAGAGCGAHWPLCNGEVVPTAPGTKTLIEYAHRITSGLVLIVSIALVVVSRRTYQAGALARKAAVGVLVLTITEALVGAGLVLFEMVASNPSLARGGWVAAHLINTFLLITAHTVTCAAARESLSLSKARVPHSWVFVVGFLALVLVGISGAVAALGDTLFPSGSLAEGIAQDADRASHLWLRLRVFHPVLAVLAAAWLLLAAFLARRSRPSARVELRALAVGTLVLGQVGFGLLNLLFLAPVWMQLVHLFLADALLIAFVLLGVELASGEEA